MVVLNSMGAITSLLDKRGHIYSHRPSLVVAGELMGMNQMRREPSGIALNADRDVVHVADAVWRRVAR